MPFYEYACLKCQTEFELLLDISKADSKQRCPECNSTRTKKMISLFGFSSDNSSSSSSCGSCTSSSCSDCSG